MSRTASLVLLAALSVGVCLVGIELMVTAVALPQILTDLADWTQPDVLRRASWIINGYLVAYVAVMPLAGRAADRFSLPGLFALSLAVFAVGSVLAGAATDMEWLIGARVVQGIGAGAIVPLATAGASHVFQGPARARAIGVVSALTFLGMAGGPFVGATILQAFPEVGEPLLAPAWRWVFYLGAPFALLAGVYTLLAAPNWRRPPGAPPSLDVLGAALFTTGVATGLVALTLVGLEPEGFVAPVPLGIVSIVAFAATGVRISRARSPFLEPRFLRDRTFVGAVVLSLLTGYGLATAIIGGAVFVDRVRYGLADEQQLVLGGLAGAMALGALGSGFVFRRIGAVVLSLAGLALSIGGLYWMSTATPSSDLGLPVAALSVFGLGFGLTVTARSAAAVEALGRSAYGVASAGVTVARMLGMAVGLAALTVLGSNRIETLSKLLVDQQARDAILPSHLQGLPLQNYLVVEVLEAWAADQAAGILSALFLVAAAVTAVAILPTLLMRNRPADDVEPTRSGAEARRASDGLESDAVGGISI